MLRKVRPQIVADVMRDGGDGEEGRTVGATLRWRNVGAVARWVNTLCGGVRVQCGALLWRNEKNGRA